MKENALDAQKIELTMEQRVSANKDLFKQMDIVLLTTKQLIVLVSNITIILKQNACPVYLTVKNAALDRVVKNVLKGSKHLFVPQKKTIQPSVGMANWKVEKIAMIIIY